MENLSPRWLTFRIILISLSAPIWLAIRLAMPDDFSTPPKWHFPFILIGFSLFGVIALSVMRPDKEWASPNWQANPLDQSRPLEGFHLSAWSLLLGALTLLVAGFFQRPIDWAWVLPGSIGLGILAGVYLVAIPERRKGP